MGTKIQGDKERKVESLGDLYIHQETVERECVWGRVWRKKNVKREKSSTAAVEKDEKVVSITLLWVK